MKYSIKTRKDIKIVEDKNTNPKVTNRTQSKI